LGFSGLKKESGGGPLEKSKTNLKNREGKKESIQIQIAYVLFKCDECSLPTGFIRVMINILHI
ncbi:MAG: hypothetical protein AABX01_03590, partial [Candidatus Micrarchaeota archaeon]